MATIIVLGAGMVGVSTALALQERGHAVTVLDRAEPGRETSHGNAGWIQGEAAEPYPFPRDLRSLLRIATGRDDAVRWSLPGVVGMTPALLGYFRASAPRRHAAISAVYSQLTGAATADHAPLIAAAGAEGLVRRDGAFFVFRSQAGFDEGASEAERYRTTYGVESRILDGAAYAREEPALIAEIAGAIHWPPTWTCRDPGALTAAYAALFAARGGRIARGDATTLARRGAGWVADADDGPVDAEAAVVALGPWSAAFVRRFGVRTAMVLKRGYHGHFAAPRSPRRPFLDVERRILAAPMRQGLRLTTGAAIVPQFSPTRPIQLKRGAAHVAELIELGPRVDEPQWVGARPCMPDMTPMVGPAPGAPGLWFNFGHGHHGFTLGPTTGRLLADALDGRRSPLLDALDPAGR